MHCKPRNDVGSYNSRQKPYLQTIWSLDIKGKLSVNMASVRHSGVSAGLTQNTGFLVPTTVGKGKPLKKKNPLDSGTFKLKNAVQTLNFKIVHFAESKNRISDAVAAGVKSVPALVIDSEVLHLNFGASMDDVKKI